MLKYNVYFKNTQIGELYINEMGKYKYEPNVEAIKEIEKTEVIFIDTKEKKDWGEPIAFFDSRIKSCKRFGKEEKISYPNSEYYFIKDNGFNGVM